MRRFAVTMTLLAAMAVAGCSGQSSKVPAFGADSGKVKVAASFYPVYEFTKAVAGEKADVILMVPPGTEPHDWEPTTGHIKALNQAALFLYNGAGMEHWVEKTVKSLDNKNLAVVETSSGLQLLKGEADGHDDNGGAGEAWDPHVWLNPQNVAKQVEAIRDALVKADAANKATYEANAGAFIKQLKALDEEFAASLTSCGKKEFFTSHAAFGYLAHRYGLEQHAIMGLAPDAEPKPKEMAKIVAEAKEHGVAYIFFETLVSDKVSSAVAREIGARTMVLNPFEGLTDEEVKAGKNYLTVMRENLGNLKIALECGK